MPIKFVCSCGQHLRAREEMARRRSVCPRCGSPVGVPALQPSHPGAAAPLTPLERWRHAQARKSFPEPMPALEPDVAGPAATCPFDPDLVRPLDQETPQPPRPRRPLETHWSHYLLFALRAGIVWLGLGVLLTMVTMSVLHLLPQLLLTELQDDPFGRAALRLTGLLVLVLLLGLPCSILQGVLTWAAAGESEDSPRTDNPLLLFLLGGVRWLGCFLAGPVLFAGTAWLYWLHWGDPALLDWLILTELSLVAGVYWILVLLSLTDRGRLRDLNPVAVIDLAHRLGWRGLVVVTVAATLLLVHGLLLLVGVTEVHHSTLTGCGLLLAGWTSGLFWGLFFCRLLGLWCYRTRPSAQGVIEFRG